MKLAKEKIFDIEGMVERLKLIVLTALYSSLVIMMSVNASYADKTLDGMYEIIGFSVEKNGQLIFDESKVHSVTGQLSVKTVSDDVIKWSASATIKMSANAQPISTSKEDRFKIVWHSTTSGKLINLHPYLKDDRSEFSLNGDKLTLRSWIARTETWETQLYNRK